MSPHPTDPATDQEASDWSPMTSITKSVALVKKVAAKLPRPERFVALTKKATAKFSRRDRSGSPRAQRDDEWPETLRSMTSTAIVLGATLIVLSILHPNLIFRNNTPTGGDMGAHVWGPAYLRDVLLPHWRLSGWSMDWYAGLPAYRFYMVVPALFILLFDLVLPYGIAFKIVAVIGLVAFPLCVWLMGRIAKLAYPLPELMVLGALLFLIDESFTIYGGNIPSTMAGEFSFVISLALSMVGLGMFARGLEDGRYRAAAAVFISLAALSHGIVLIFVFGGAVVMLLLRLDRQRLKWATTTLVAAVLLSAFWVLPFLGGHRYMTDMKYEPRPSGANDSLWQMYFPLATSLDLLVLGLATIGFVGSFVRRRFLGVWMGVYVVILMIGVNVAQRSLPVIGLLWNPRLLPFMYLLRYMLALLGVYELGLFALRALAQRRGREVAGSPLTWSTSFAWVGALAVLLVVGVRYQSLPFADLNAGSSGTRYGWGPVSFPANRAFSDGWARWNFEGYEGKAAYGEYHGIVETMRKLGEDPAHGCGRAVWENNGELNKYGTTMGLMLLPHWTSGCIGSMEGLFFEAAGTTPYHFITAAAVSKQSSNPVRELRYDNNRADLGTEYMRTLGVRYLMAFTPEAVTEADAQDDLEKVATSGPWHVYEIADTTLVEPLSVEPVVIKERGGDQRERWLEVGTSYFQHRDEWAALPSDGGPEEWSRIEVDVDESRKVGEPGEPSRQVDVVVPSASTPITAKALPEVTVSDVKIEDESLSFAVDKVGVPVLVKVSYFPNWEATGADGPWRVAPNMMVVIPTDTQVRMSYEPSGLDRFAYLLTFIGIGMTAWMARRRFRYGTSADAVAVPAAG